MSDRTDGKLAHLDGLNLSRAWMLEGIASALPEDDVRRSALVVAAHEHREAGLASVTGEHYAGGHWLGSFATYLVTGRGLPAARSRSGGSQRSIEVELAAGPRYLIRNRTMAPRVIELRVGAVEDLVENVGLVVGVESRWSRGRSVNWRPRRPM